MRLQDKVAIVTGAASGHGRRHSAAVRARRRQGHRRRHAGGRRPGGRPIDQVQQRRGPLPAPRRLQREGLGRRRRRHARRLRQDRYPHQQCRRERQRSRPSQHRHLGPADEHQCQGRVPRHARGDPRDAEGQERIDRQHLLDFRRRRPDLRAHGLQRLQGRRAHHEQGRSRAVREGRHPRQLGASGADARHAHLSAVRRPQGACRPC